MAAQAKRKSRAEARKGNTHDRKNSENDDDPDNDSNDDVDDCDDGERIGLTSLISGFHWDEKGYE